MKASRAAGLDRVALRSPSSWSGDRMRGIFVAAGVALAISILLTPYLIRFFSRQGFGQEIREDGPQSHQAKRGTPTMGGAAIMIAIVAGLPRCRTWSPASGSAPSALLLLFLTTGAGRRRLPGRLHQDPPAAQPRPQQDVEDHRPGAHRASIFGILALRFANADGLTPGSDSLSFVRDIAVLSFGAGRLRAASPT